MKVSKKNYIRHMWGGVFYAVFSVSLPFILNTKGGNEYIEFAMKLSLGFFMIMCVPALISFYRYVVVSRNIEINYDRNKIEIVQKTYSRTVELKEVKQIDMVLTLPVYFGGFRFFATDSFFYAVIQLKSNECFTVTTFIDNELLDTKSFFADKVSFNKKPRLICWPPKIKLGKSA